MQRVILHLDLDAFFCAVEEQLNPDLRGKAFAVGGKPSERGVVASCSYPARAYGIHSAMPMSRAVQKCPHLFIVDRHMGDYKNASRRVMTLLRELTPLVEQLSIDEAFLDVTELAEDGVTLAQQLQHRINTELRLPCSLGVASNKLVAKIANNQGKSQAEKGQYPNAIEIVPFGNEAEYLAPLAIRELWGVGPVTADKMHEMGIYTIGQLAETESTLLIEEFGKIGYDLWLRARGIDSRPVLTERPTKSISNEITFERDVNDRTIVTNTLKEMCESVGQQLRKSKLLGRTVKIKLRWSDFTTITRQTTVDNPCNTEEWIFEHALELLDEAWDGKSTMRLIGVGVANFDNTVRQLSLWEEN